MPTLKVPVTPKDHIQGDEHALVTLVEYGDYECPFCGMVYPVIKALQKHYGKKLRFVFRNFPLLEAHPHAEMAAEAAEYAGDHGRFWDMHDQIYENQQDLEPELLLQLAEYLELSVDDLEAAIEDKAYEAEIKKDFMGGVRSGVNGTPTFFINDERYNGSYDYESLVSAIDAAMYTKHR